MGYIPPGLAWQGDVTGKKYEPEPEKMMEYTLKETEKGEYQIYSVANAIIDGPSNTDPGNAVSDLGAGDDNAPDGNTSSDETQDGTESTPEQSQESASESSEAA